MTIAEHHEVRETQGDRLETTTAESRMVFSPGQVIAGILGAIMAIIGAITAARAGIDGSLNTPVVRVGGFDQSAMLGLIELGLGLLLILGAASYATRNLIATVGVILVIGGVVIGAAGATLLQDIGTVHGTGWALMVSGIIALVAASLGRIITTRRSVRVN